MREKFELVEKVFYSCGLFFIEWGEGMVAFVMTQGVAEIMPWFSA